MEIRKNNDGSIDEVVGAGYYHLEQMRSDFWTLILEDGPMTVCLEIGSARKVSVVECWSENLEAKIQSRRKGIE